MPTVPTLTRPDGLAVAAAVVSVRPQPSKMGMPMARKKWAVLGFSGAPPLTKNFRCPPKRARILDSTSLSATR